MTKAADNLYALDAEGIAVGPRSIEQRLDEYDDTEIEQLVDMQDRHFWYRGRHAFLLKHVQRILQKHGNGRPVGRMVDLGGGCGGWVRYLSRHLKLPVSELALADSSRRALTLAKQHEVITSDVHRYQIDLMQLHWTDYWDACFLLDVLEHVPDHERAMQEVCKAVKPGGLIFVATPALKCFWSHNDELVHHVRRYSKQDMRNLAAASGLELVDARYFMFLLSPLLWLSRLKRPPIETMSPEEIRAFQTASHRVPSKPVNAMLTTLFMSEVLMSRWFRYPWGTSIFAAFRKPHPAAHPV